MRADQALVYGGIPGATIIGLHASGGSGAQWKMLANEMRRDFRVLTPDLYGHGTAPDWPGDASEIVTADAARIARLAADAGGAVHLVGHSYGGAIALRVALGHPELVSSVAVYEPVAMRLLFDYNAKHRAATEVAELARDVRRAMQAEDLEGAARRFVDYWAGAGSWARSTPERQAYTARRMPVIDAHFTSLFRDAVRLSDYGNLRCPVLYLTGRESRASTRRISELLEYALTDVTPIRYDAMGHLGPVTHADAVTQDIARFIRSRDARRIARERKAA